MRVLWVVPGFPTGQADSSYAFLREEAEALTRHSDVDLHLLPMAGSALPGRWTAHLRDQPTRLETMRWAARHRDQFGPAASRRPASWVPLAKRSIGIEKLVQSIRPDILHSHFAEPLGTGAVDVARNAGVASVVSLRGVDVARIPDIGYGYRLDAEYEARLRRNLPRAARVLVATTEMAEHAVSAGADRGTIRVVPNAMHRLTEPDRAHDRPQADPIRAVAVGRLVGVKSFETAIQALRGTTTVLSIIGDGPERAKLLDLADDLAPGRVDLVGALPPDRLLDRMAESDVFWCTSRFEGFGNVIIEAAAVGLPIVSSRVGVAVDLVPALDRAAFFDGSPTDLTAQTHRVLAQPTVDRTTVMDRFDPERRVERLMTVYRDALDARGVAAR